MCRSAPHRTHVRCEHARCDEKVTHAANVAAEANLRLAGRMESVTLPAPNHGRFLLHLKAPRVGAFFCDRCKNRASPARPRYAIRPTAAASAPALRIRPA